MDAKGVHVLLVILDETRRMKRKRTRGGRKGESTARRSGVHVLQRGEREIVRALEPIGGLPRGVAGDEMDAVSVARLCAGVRSGEVHVGTVEEDERSGRNFQRVRGVEVVRRICADEFNLSRATGVVHSHDARHWRRSRKRKETPIFHRAILQREPDSDACRRRCVQKGAVLMRDDLAADARLFEDVH